MRRDYELRRAQGVLLFPHAVKLAVQPLVDAGFEPLVFKGPALARRYPEAGLRPMDDLDVIVESHRHDDALRILLREGWVEYERAGDHYDTILQHDDVPDLPLELHRGLESWRERTTRITSDGLWRARVPQDCFGTPCWGIPPEEEFAALAAHAGKPYHNFQRLVWSVDLAVVVQHAGAAMDWDRLAALSEEFGTTTVVSVGLVHARRLGAPIPDAAIRLPASRLRRLALSPVLDETWPLQPWDDGVAHRLRYALWDRRSRQVLLLLGEITVEGPAKIPKRIANVVRLTARRLWSWRRTGTPDVADYTENIT